MKKDSHRHSFPLRRGLSASEAAIYIGVGTTTFQNLVGDKLMPKPRGAYSCRLWDVDDLDAWFKSLPIIGDDKEVDTWADLDQK